MMYDVTNKKVIGQFEDELNGILLHEYCGLRSKMYSYICEKEDKIKNPIRCKVINKSVVSKTITMNNLKDVYLRIKRCVEKIIVQEFININYIPLN